MLSARFLASTPVCQLLRMCSRVGCDRRRWNRWHQRRQLQMTGWGWREEEHEQQLLTFIFLVCIHMLCSLRFSHVECTWFGLVRQMEPASPWLKRRRYPHGECSALALSWQSELPRSFLKQVGKGLPFVSVNLAKREPLTEDIACNTDVLRCVLRLHPQRMPSEYMMAEAILMLDPK